MGCDIHAYPEYFEMDRWWSIGQRINPGRNYSVFTELAKVRGISDTSLDPKGLPSDLGYYAFGDYWLYVLDNKSDDCDGTCSRENAEKWVENKSSVYYDDEKKRVSDPDAHSASWVDLKEFKTCLKNADERRKISPIYHGLAAMLEEIENRGLKTRLVFWFDN